MNWNKISETAIPSPSDYPVVLLDARNKKMSVVEIYSRCRFATPWTHWSQLDAPVVEKTRAELDMDIAQLISKNDHSVCPETLLYGVECVAAGRRDFKKSIEAMLEEISVYAKSMNSGPINYEAVVFNISKLVHEGTGDDT